MSTTEDADDRVRDLRDCVDSVVEHGDPRVTEILADALSYAFRLSQMDPSGSDFAEAHGKLTSKLYALRRCWKDDMKCEPTEFPRALAVLSLPGPSSQFIQKEAAKCAAAFEQLFLYIIELSQAKPVMRGSVH